MTNDSSDANENPLHDWAARVTGSSADSQNVNLTESASERVEGGQIRMEGSVARSVQGQAIRMEGSAAGLLRADAVDVHESMVGLMAVKDASLEDTASLGFVAQTVRAKNISSAIFVSGRTEGNVETIFTPVTALLVGAGFGLFYHLATVLFGKVWPFRRQTRK